MCCVRHSKRLCGKCKLQKVDSQWVERLSDMPNLSQASTTIITKGLITEKTDDLGPDA